MTPEQFTAIVGLGGVALGIGGTLAAARLQLKGSHVQAEATRRAAETTAVTQYAATLVQQNRASQRAAYVGMMTAGRDFQRVAGAVSDGGRRWSDPDPLVTPLQNLYAAFATVELEGPSEVVTAAFRIIDPAVDLLGSFKDEKKTLRAWSKLHAAQEGELEPIVAHAELLLSQLRQANRALSSSLRMQLVMADGDALTASLSMGTAGDAWNTAWTRTQGQLTRLVERAALEDCDTRWLLRDAGLINPSIQESMQSTYEDLDIGISAFVQAARATLANIAPELGPSS